MKGFRDLSLTVKVAVLLTLMAALSGGLTIASLLRMGEIDRSYSDLIDRDSDGVKWLSRVNSTLNAIGLESYRMIAETDPAIIRKSIDAAADELRTFQERVDKVRRALPAMEAELQAVSQSFLPIIRTMPDLQRLALANDDAAAMTLMRQGFTPAYGDVRAKVRALLSRAEADMQASSDQVTATYESARFWTLAVGGLGIPACFGLALAVMRMGVSRPFLSLRDRMERLSRHEMEVEIQGLDRRDEVGAMARAVQVFKDGLIEAGRLAAAQSAEQAAKLRRTEAIERLIRDFDQQVAAVLRVVSAAAAELDSTARHMVETAGRSSDQAVSAAEVSRQTSANVQTVASATEEMSSSIGEISSQVTRSASIASQAVDEAGRTTDTVRGLADAAQRIGAVVQLISTIAGQTNLLALNATIEAARAGEAGKGFAVVANEVKSLASQTARATEEIAGQVGGIQAATENAVQAIDGISGTISTINDISASIAAAIEEQGAATAEISRNIQQAAAGTGEVTATIVGVTEAAEETGTAAAKVRAAAGSLSEQADSLRRNVEGFLTAIKAA
ncbi:methyl-accepting chemotaxis protein [Azospirillum thermophilum]|uniref:Methyl-accepting chemotaxis protein n=1 Tax=Azospirillum thermophilum TaxID=2202148 RepID=A0A2S2CU58_9PROT|nr:methyl-accepting chemotaxis protein [Azospirillum thermophilum]AWK88054.1 methyl-accepting chemotaxis protein [Azospirillum thermophilum]